MHLVRLAVISMIALATACGDDGPSGPEPRVIEGGGIGDGPIDGVANLYVIDDRTRDPIAGAQVAVGDQKGMTDETGLFVASGVTGPQTVAVTATGFRSEMWVGANGANMTVNLQAAQLAIPGRANITGSIANWGAVVVPQGHLKAALVVYSQTDDIGDPANEIQTANETNLCGSAASGTECNFTVTTRTGQVALLALLIDIDPKGTPDESDDTISFIGYAHKPGLTVVDGQDQTGVQLAVLPGTAIQNATVDFGSPPANLNARAAIVGIEVGNDGVFQLGAFIRTPQDATVGVPKLDALGASGYRLTAIATDGDPATQQSVVLRRDLTGTTLPAGAWLTPPASATATRTGASWQTVDGSTVHSFELETGSTRVVSVTVFDDSTEVTLHESITVPSGALTARVNAIGAPGLDVTNFALDEDREKLVQIGQRVIQIP